MPAIAITDHGSMASFPDAFIASQKHNIKFIPGCETYYNDSHAELKEFQASIKAGGIKWAALKDKDIERWQRLRRHRHLTVLAKNATGYKNLIHMTSDAWEIGYYYKPRIWMDRLDKHREGLVVLSGCLNGPLNHEIRRAAELVDKSISDEDIGFAWAERVSKAKKHLKMAREWLQSMYEIFGKDLYVEMQMPGLNVPHSVEAFRFCAKFSNEFNIKSVITNDCHYIKRADFEVQKCMMAIDQNMTLDDPNLFHVNSDEQFFKSRAQLRQLFNESPYHKGVKIDKFEQSCDNTLEVAEKCRGFEPNLDPKLPSIEAANKKLVLLVLSALKTKGLYDNQAKYHMDGAMVTHKEQAELELKRIISKGFASYFIITKDLVQYSLDQGWDVGPARGSAGGSLVCYLLGIHELNPLKWGLSFNRFLSPSRGGYLLNVSLE
jgi:DNA polymerase-3 subunit alpha